MKLNNGRYVVETDNADQIAVSPMRKEGGGYSHETEKIFTLWRSKTTGKHFITMAYREYIIGCFFLKRGTAIEGNTLVCTSEQDDFINQCWRCGLPLPQEMQIVVA